DPKGLQVSRGHDFCCGSAWVLQLRKDRANSATSSSSPSCSIPRRPVHYRSRSRSCPRYLWSTGLHVSLRATPKAAGTEQLHHVAKTLANSPDAVGVLDLDTGLLFGHGLPNGLGNLGAKLFRPDEPCIGLEEDRKSVV